MTHTSIPAGTHIGHVHLKVADLERSVRFYSDIMGFDLLMNMGTAAFLSAGGYHHHLGLNTWESLNGSPPAKGTTGMYHYAINYPTRKDLAVALVRILESGWGIDGASETDGLEVSSANLGGRFARGMLVVQDGYKRLPDGAQNFKYVAWEDIASSLRLP